MGATGTEPHTDWWGDLINEDRQRELDDLAEQQLIWAERPPEIRGVSPLRSIRGSRLSGADVFWLAKRAYVGPKGSAETLSRAGMDLQDGMNTYLDLPRLHLEDANLSAAHLEGAHLSNAHLERADFSNAHLKDALLRGVRLEYARLLTADLENANLLDAHLEGADLKNACLEDAYLNRAYLEGADLTMASLERANLSSAHLEGTRLSLASLQGADLSAACLEAAHIYAAHLEGADLRDAHLEGTSLTMVHLEGADLSSAHLEGKTYATNDPDLARIRAFVPDFPSDLPLPPTDLREAVFDAATVLKGISLGDAQHGTVRVADVRWGSANLAVVDWTPLIEPEPCLGDERAAWTWRPTRFRQQSDNKKFTNEQLLASLEQHQKRQAQEKLEVFRAAVRANRQLATALREQGMNEEADQFAYRAQVLQRQVFWQQHKRGRAIFSWFLDRVAGHGYKPQRSLYTYLIVLAAFTILYLLAGNGILTFGLPPTQFHHIAWYEAIVLSVASFHGRGFFQPVQSPGDPVAILAAIEAVFGLFIEVSFIATFTQRFFGK